MNKIALRHVPYYQHADIKTVEVYLREPFDRYVSGVQTYLNRRDDLDRETALKMIEEFLFLNSHFSLQFHWIVNLARHCDAWMYFRHIDELRDTTSEVWNTLSRDQNLLDRFSENRKLHYYLMLDKIIYENFIGRTVSFRRVCEYIEQEHPYIHEEIIQRSQDICNVLG